MRFGTREEYASDMDCFQPLMDRFHSNYGFYQEFPMADAGYDSYNNYLFCEKHGMNKYMKFPKKIRFSAYRFGEGKSI